MSFEDGPYVTIACFCDLVLEDKSGVLSLIRIIDTLTHTEAAPEPPREMPTFQYKNNLVVMLKSGAARGRYELRIIPQLPDGSTEREIALTAHFEGEERGQNIIAQLDFRYKMEGYYLFKVMLEDELLTAIPLRVKYNRVKTAGT
jgi:hypothetical protein